MTTPPLAIWLWKYWFNVLMDEITIYNNQEKKCLYEQSYFTDYRHKVKPMENVICGGRTIDLWNSSVLLGIYLLYYLEVVAFVICTECIYIIWGISFVWMLCIFLYKEFFKITPYCFWLLTCWSCESFFLGPFLLLVSHFIVCFCSILYHRYAIYTKNIWKCVQFNRNAWQEELGKCVKVDTWVRSAERSKIEPRIFNSKCEFRHHPCLQKQVGIFSFTENSPIKATNKLLRQCCVDGFYFYPAATLACSRWLTKSASQKHFQQLNAKLWQT